ncbi:MAG: hypothetical protein ACM3PE_11250 [Deltaproteobacteria bacterium]
MQEVPAFKLVFVEQKDFLLLPNVMSIKVVQHLYDVLFQYAITEEHEEKLKKFIGRMEAHIKTKTRTPFAMPLADLEFLDEGLEELRLLNWMQEKLSIFEIALEDASKLDDVMEMLGNIMILSRVADTDQILVFPQGITVY